MENEKEVKQIVLPKHPLVWIDCEMTGLDPEVDELVEIAVVITNFDLEPIGPGMDLVIKAGDAALKQMDDFVTNMHTESGLIEDIPHGLELGDAQEKVLQYIQKYVPTAGVAQLAGNSIGQDQRFLREYMPEVVDYLHYRVIDVSTIKELAKRWYPRVYASAPEKNGGHRALNDILESIRELAYYRAALFPAELDPTSGVYRELAAEIEKQYHVG